MPDIISDRAERRDGEGAGDAGAVVAERVAQRLARDGAFVLLAVELGRFVHRRARDPHARRERRADEERDAPAPARRARARSSRLTVSAETPTASSAPTSLAAEAEEVIRPRRRGARAFEQIGDDAGIFAADRETHHAAQERAAASLRRARSAARVGSSAVASIAAVISATDISIMCRRPRRSPIWPKKIAPSGRIR